MMALVAWVGFILVSGAIFYFTSHKFSYPDFWIAAIVKCKGGEKGLNPNKMFSNIAFIDTAGASNIFGAYFGIMLDAMYLKGTPSSANDTTILKSLGRALVTIVCIAPLMLPYVFVPDTSPIMLVYMFKRTVPFFLVMLVLFSFVKIIHAKLGLLAATGQNSLMK